MALDVSGIAKDFTGIPEIPNKDKYEIRTFPGTIWDKKPEVGNIPKLPGTIWDEEKPTFKQPWDEVPTLPKQPWDEKPSEVPTGNI